MTSQANFLSEPLIPTRIFKELWTDAIKKVEQSEIGRSLRWKALLNEMSSCSSAEQICERLEQTVTALKSTRGNDSKWGELRTKYLKPAAEGILVLTTAFSVIASSIPGIPGGNAIFAALGMLLKATKGLSERFEALIGLFEEMGFFLDSLRIRANASEAVGPAARTVGIAILAHLLDVFFLATKLIMEPAWRARFVLYRQAFANDDKVQRALDRLRMLAGLETRAITAETRATTAGTHAIASDIRMIAKDTQDAVLVMKKELIHFMKAEVHFLSSSYPFETELSFIERRTSMERCVARTARFALLTEVTYRNNQNTRPHWLR
ncbi:hypothetical protein PENSPDRAFT_147487 [Peniophora sp. CONT]|nr:hypothetical protein PENSPDRAFT_147487 [Peniophora sp. CONT]